MHYQYSSCDITVDADELKSQNASIQQTMKGFFINTVVIFKVQGGKVYHALHFQAKYL